MRILIDLQGLQPLSNTEMPHRSHALTLTKRIAAELHDRGHHVILLLDGRVQDDAKRARRAFAGSVRPHDLRLWHPPEAPLVQSTLGVQTLRGLYETFVAQLQPDLLYVANLPSQAGQSPLWSAGLLAPRKVAVAVHERPGPGSSSFPARAPQDAVIDPEALRGADLLITTSEWALRGLVGQAGPPGGGRMIVTPEAGEDFTPTNDSLSTGTDELLARWGLFKPFIVCPALSGDASAAGHAVSAFALLPAAQREAHQLVIAHVQPQETFAPVIEALAGRHSLTENDVIAVSVAKPAERAELYRRCALAAVLHCDGDAFCFSALEALGCDAPLIAANHASLPDIVADDQALFDADNPAAMADKIVRALTDPDFRIALSSNGTKRAPRRAPQDAASRAVAALEALAATPAASEAGETLRTRPRLAYISPLPPERSGISDYSADLVPELAKYYEIELIVNQATVEAPALKDCFPIRDCDYFLRHADTYDRVLYHFGNSRFHEHMFALLSRVPGTVVLHDFFLGDVQAYLEWKGGWPHAWTKELYKSHGYGAVMDRFQAESPSRFVGRYPCSFGVVGQADGVVVHSPHALDLAEQWYGPVNRARFTELPLLRKPSLDPSEDKRNIARNQLGLQEDDFVVCSFGLLGPTKQNHRLLQAWKESSLAQEQRCKLIFVGENHGEAYAAQIQCLIDSLPAGQVTVTGWMSGEGFRSYLEAADLAVQLRTQSRGEMSAAVLDAMNHGIPTIVNSNGALAHLPQDTVKMLDDEFTDAELAEALDRLWRDAQQRHSLSGRARALVAEQHAPQACAHRYMLAIEHFAATSRSGRDGLIRRLRDGLPNAPAIGSNEIRALAKTISETLPASQPARQLLLDISAVVQHDLHTGIQRVVKSLLLALIDTPPAGFRVEPVYALPGQLGYRYARRFTLRCLGAPEDALDDELISFREGDHFVGVDLMHDPIPFQAPFLHRMHSAGVGVHFVVYDMLPILLPHRFPPASAALHARWLRTIADFDSALCISKAVAEELAVWLDQHMPDSREQGFKIRSFHLGADLGTGGTKGLPDDAGATLQAIGAGASFLMVGTVEPRKGHALALDAFERLWRAGHEVNLVIVGKQGWMVDEIAQRLRSHVERGRRLFWLEGASDEYLERIYGASTCLLAASDGEGFGLPLIEGAQHNLPILARDIPVFREVAGDHAFYFAGNSAALAEAVTQWTSLNRRGLHPQSETMPYLHWSESAKQFIAAVLGD